MRGANRPALLALLIAALVVTSPTAVNSAGPQSTLAPPESFDGIGDTAARSAALLSETGKVLTSPCCVNCHPAGDRPLQGDAGRPHQPPVQRGADDPLVGWALAPGLGAGLIALALIVAT